MGRSILAVIAGLVLGVVLIGVVEFSGHYVYPPPAGMDMKDAEAMKSLVASLPVGALLFVILAWAVGSFGGGWLTARIAQKSHVMHALIVGGILMAAGIMNMLTIPHPLWFWVLGVAVYLPAAYAGALLGQKRQA